MRKTAILIIFVFLVCVLAAGTARVMAQERITPLEAKDYVGKKVTVCGVVASAKFAAMSKGRPTFLNLDRPYPNQIFTVVIWGKDRDKFGTPPEQTYRGKKICVTGTVSIFRNTPQIVVSDPSQISMKD